jgi:hypothetical protein
MLTRQRKSIRPNETKDFTRFVKTLHSGVDGEEAVFVKDRPTYKVAKFGDMRNGLDHLRW